MGAMKTTFGKLPCLLALWVAASSVTMVGCSSMSGYPSGDPATLIAKDTSNYLSDAAVKQYQETPSRSLRNRIVLTRMAWIDQHFREFEKAIHQESLRAAVGVDWVLLAISSATTIAGGESVKSLLGAASTGIQGAKSSFDKRVFRDKSVGSVLAHMKALRAERALTIRKGLAASIDMYPLEYALADLGRYYEAGTLSEAMSSIVETANVKKAEAESQLEILLNDTYGYDDASEKLTTYIYPSGLDGSPNSGNKTNAENCMKDLELLTGPGMVAALITGGNPATARARIAVAVCLDLM